MAVIQRTEAEVHFDNARATCDVARAACDDLGAKYDVSRAACDDLGAKYDVSRAACDDLYAKYKVARAAYVLRTKWMFTISLLLNGVVLLGMFVVKK